MTTENNSDNYEKASKLAEQGKYDEAFDSICLYLAGNPEDIQALNDAGAILHCQGKSSEAITYLERARELSPENGQIIWNLAEAYLGYERPEKVIELLPEIKAQGLMNPDLINRTADIFLNQNNKSEAIETLLYSLDFAPEQEVLKPMLDVIKSKRPKVSFFCGLTGDTKFLTDIYDFSSLRYTTKFFHERTLEQMYNLMKKSDIAWFEWCTDMVVNASKMPKVCKNIVRLHSFEAYATPYPKEVNWENIDVLILVGNSYTKDALLAQVPDIEKRTRVVTIPNGVNLDKYYFTKRTPGKNIACVGYLNIAKNPMAILQCMQKLHYINPEYKLFFGGNFQELKLEQYLKHMVAALELEDVVFFDGWQRDIVSWLADKHYIVSGSIGESQGMGILEGMAAGLKPVIHNFPGADQIFGTKYLFNIAEQFCEQILSEEYDSDEYRNFVKQRYPQREQLTAINSIFTDFEREIDFGKKMGFNKEFSSLIAPIANEMVHENICM
ncbi:MAG TPA: glycosyltransferase [Sedimentisphaerales bacterium]|nr:glycosyltransferase [Sedimentisphaerales bacterium]